MVEGERRKQGNECETVADRRGKSTRVSPCSQHHGPQAADTLTRPPLLHSGFVSGFETDSKTAHVHVLPEGAHETLP